MPATELTQEESQLINRNLAEKVYSRNPSLVKEAEDELSDFTRMRMREEGFWRKIINVKPVTNKDLDRDPYSDKPRMIFEKEPNSPAAVSLPFANTPSFVYLKGNRYEVKIQRISTPRFSKDVDELRTWEMDFRQIVSDNSIKDLLAEEDGVFLRSVNTCLVGPEQIVPYSGVVQHEVISGGITRNSLQDGFKVMPNTPASFEVHSVLINHITIRDVCKLNTIETGEQISSDIMRNGWTLQDYMGVKWNITIKKGLVPTGTMYHFGDPSALGKAVELEAPTMFIRREYFMLEFFSYEMIGHTIANSSSVARIDYR